MTTTVYRRGCARILLNADATGSRVVADGWSFDGTNNTEDCNGHGTATASLAGGRTVGSSPNATLRHVAVTAQRRLLI